LHVFDLGKALISGDLDSAFTTICFLLGLSALGICLAQPIAKTDGLGTFVVIISRDLVPKGLLLLGSLNNLVL
jgi:hypothetical protein